jgi:hypothetical protein
LEEDMPSKLGTVIDGSWEFDKKIVLVGGICRTNRMGSGKDDGQVKSTDR